MHARVDEFVETARERYGLSIDVEEFPEHGTPTAEDAAAAVDCAVDQIVKSLLFTVDDDAVLCLTAGGNRVDEAALAGEFDADSSSVSMASPDRVRDVTGWAIGGVPPICHERSVPTVLDPTLPTFDRVWAAAGTPSSMWAVDPDRLRDLTDASVVDVTE